MGWDRKAHQWPHGLHSPFAEPLTVHMLLTCEREMTIQQQSIFIHQHETTFPGTGVLVHPCIMQVQLVKLE